MTARCTAGIIALAAVGTLAWATLAQAGDPAPVTTTVQTVVVTTPAPRVQGRGVQWWSRRAVQARKDANARGRTIGRLRRANRARLQFGPDGLTHAFLCIHSFEGAWNDSGAPYWGGIQADRDFMATYGGPFYRAWGTADHWPPFVQIAVAEAAFLSGRGFGPWPLTSKACGL